jgi:hypothetical protein
MLKSLREHPLLCVTQVLAFLIALPAFFSTMSFTSALTSEQAVAEYNKPLPSGWTAGVMNHGDYYRWWTIQERPILFGASVFFWWQECCLFMALSFGSGNKTRKASL